MKIKGGLGKKRKKRDIVKMMTSSLSHEKVTLHIFTIRILLFKSLYIILNGELGCYIIRMVQ